MKLNKYIQKLCCFYASDWHLTVMLLPYINNKVEENCSIYMKCENNIEEKMNILLNKLTLKNKKNIMNINWCIIRKMSQSRYRSRSSWRMQIRCETNRSTYKRF